MDFSYNQVRSVYVCCVCSGRVCEVVCVFGLCVFRLCRVPVGGEGESCVCLCSSVWACVYVPVFVFVRAYVRVCTCV